MSFMGFQEPFNNLLAVLAVIFFVSMGLSEIVGALVRPFRRSREASAGKVSLSSSEPIEVILTISEWPPKMPIWAARKREEDD